MLGRWRPIVRRWIAKLELYSRKVEAHSREVEAPNKEAESQTRKVEPVHLAPLEGEHPGRVIVLDGHNTSLRRPQHRSLRLMQLDAKRLVRLGLGVVDEPHAHLYRG